MLDSLRFGYPTIAWSGNKMESDHSIKTVQAKGAAVSHSGGGKIPYALPYVPNMQSRSLSHDHQVSEACLVTVGGLVRAACELESEHGNHGWFNHWHHGHGVERQRRTRKTDTIP